jgi:hypothetical protein
MNVSTAAQRMRKLVHRCAWTALALMAPAAPDLHAITDSVDPSDSVVVCDEPAFVEPEFGYVTARGRLLDESLQPNVPHSKATWRVALPSPVDVLQRIRARDTHVVEQGTVVSLRHLWEWNYFHFVFDVLGKLQVLDEVAGADAAPIALGRYAGQLPFAERAIEMGRLSGRRWLVPDQDNRTIIRAERVIFGRTGRSLGQRAEYIRELLGAAPADQAGSERVFLTRRPPHGRRLLNEDDILRVTRRHGFEVVDAAELTLDEQIKLFSSTRHLAVHGAGLTNIIFRAGAPLSLLELHGDRYPGPGNMRRICAELGYQHAALAGPQTKGGAQGANFAIDPGELASALPRLLDT